MLKNERLRRLLAKGSGPYLVIFRERGKRKPEHKVYYMEDIVEYANDISYLLEDPESNYEMIVYEVRLKPIFRVEPISKEKAEAVWIITVDNMSEDGFILRREHKEGALVISVDREA